MTPGSGLIKPELFWIRIQEEELERIDLEALSSGARIAAQQSGRIGPANQSNSGILLGLECSEANDRCFYTESTLIRGKRRF